MSWLKHLMGVNGIQTSWTYDIRYFSFFQFLQKNKYYVYSRHHALSACAEPPPSSFPHSPLASIFMCSTRVRTSFKPWSATLRSPKTTLTSHLHHVYPKRIFRWIPSQRHVVINICDLIFINFKIVLKVYSCTFLSFKKNGYKIPWYSCAGVGAARVG